MRIIFWKITLFPIGNIVVLAAAFEVGIQYNFTRGF